MRLYETYLQRIKYLFDISWYGKFIDSILNYFKCFIYSSLYCNSSLMNFQLRNLNFARNFHRHKKHFWQTNEPDWAPAKLHVCLGAFQNLFASVEASCVERVNLCCLQKCIQKLQLRFSVRLFIFLRQIGAVGGRFYF